MSTLGRWMEKQLQGSSAERPLERTSVTMDIREAEKTASKFESTASKSSMDSIPTPFAMRYTQLSTLC